MPKRNYLNIIWRVLALPVWTLFMVGIYFVAKLLKLSCYSDLVHNYHQGMCKILGLNVHYEGTCSTNNPVLFVSNHISYLDIIVLGKIRGFYVAKAEVAGWPVLGWLAQFQNTIFIERKAARSREHLLLLRKHLQNNNNLILFPEGTSTDGKHVEPFKSSLFASAGQQTAEAKRVTIQPITVSYTHYAGEKMNQPVRDYYAWYGTVSFGAHFLRVLPLKSADVSVYFHDEVYLDQFKSRKECADYCQKVVAKKLAESIK